MTKRILSFQDIEIVVQFLLNYAEANAIVLPGRVAAFHRWDVKVLPSSVTKSSVWRQYKEVTTAAGLHVPFDWTRYYAFCAPSGVIFFVSRLCVFDGALFSVQCVVFTLIAPSFSNNTGFNGYFVQFVVLVLLLSGFYIILF